MSVDSRAFDENIATWKAEMQQPWMALRYKMEQTHIRRHIGADSLRILDAGGGNGRHAITLAKAGHEVALVDYSAEMLADARRAAGEADVAGRITFHQADLMAIPSLFPGATFDLALCHNVIQYVDDVPAALEAVRATMKPGALLSLVTVNNHSEPFKAALIEGDLARAYDQLGEKPTRSTVFGTIMHRFTGERLDDLLVTAGFAPVARYGIRCLCDWLPNERKADPDFMAQLERLELAMATRYPYYLLARFIQIIARVTNVDT